MAMLLMRGEGETEAGSRRMEIARGVKGAPRWRNAKGEEGVGVGRYGGGVR